MLGGCAYPLRPIGAWRRSRRLVFWDARECAPGPQGRLNRPSSTIVAGWADEEAHGRAMNRSGGLLRSVAGQGPRGARDPARGASDQRKQAEAGAAGPPTPRGTHQGRGWGTHRGGIRGVIRGPVGGGKGAENRRRSGRESRLGITPEIARRGGSWGRNRPRRGRDPAPGRVRPMASPGGNTTRHESARRQARSSSAARRRQPGRPGARRAACGRSSLTPGRAGWSPGHGSGRSALRAAAPAGRRCRAGQGHQRPGRTEPLPCRRRLGWRVSVRCRSGQPVQVAALAHGGCARDAAPPPGTPAGLAWPVDSGVPCSSVE